MSKGTESGHRHRWIDNTRVEDAGTRYVCTCGTTYFEPFLPRVTDETPHDLYYLKEG